MAGLCGHKAAGEWRVEAETRKLISNFLHTFIESVVFDCMLRKLQNPVTRKIYTCGVK